MIADVDELLNTYVAAWNRMDFEALAGMWHRDESEIYYVAEEIEHAFHDLAEVLAYWRATKEMLESVSMSIANRRHKSLSDDVCVTSYEMHIDIGMRGTAKHRLKPIGTDVRVSALLRKTSAGWRFIHYAEATLGALPFVRRAYNANVRAQ